MNADRWTARDLAAAGGLAVAIAATADLGWSLHARFAVDFSGLSALERAGAALWDFRPLATGLFLVGATVALAAIREPVGRLAPVRGPVGNGLAVLAAAHAALALVVLAAATWVAAAGELGERDELGFAYSSSERVVTLVTQIAAWLPLGVALGVLAIVASGMDEDVEAANAEPAQSADRPPARSLGDEMEELWREHLAFGPGRERGRALLGRIRALEAAGDAARARELAAELRALAGR